MVKWKKIRPSELPIARCQFKLVLKIDSLLFNQSITGGALISKFITTATADGLVGVSRFVSLFGSSWGSRVKMNMAAIIGHNCGHHFRVARPVCRLK